MSVATAPNIGAADRMSFTVFLAAAAHIIFVLIPILPEDPEPTATTMEITLSKFKDEKAPENADFLAQTNQIGSGTLEEKAQITTREVAEIEAAELRKTLQQPQEQTVIQKPQLNQKEAIITKGESDFESSLFATIDDNVSETKHSQKSLLERSMEIAALEASLDRQMQSYARKPKIKRLTAASTVAAADAEYVRHVLDKLVRTADLNFPKNEKGKSIYGKTRIAIGIYIDGSIRDIKILEKSGNRLLDDAAIRIIRIASPFAPIPESVRSEKDVLEIIRTFSFQKKGFSSY